MSTREGRKKEKVKRDGRCQLNSCPKFCQPKFWAKGRACSEKRPTIVCATRKEQGEKTPLPISKRKKQPAKTHDWEKRKNKGQNKSPLLSKGSEGERHPGKTNVRRSEDVPPGGGRPKKSAASKNHNCLNEKKKYSLGSHKGGDRRSGGNAAGVAKKNTSCGLTIVGVLGGGLGKIEPIESEEKESSPRAGQQDDGEWGIQNEGKNHRIKVRKKKEDVVPQLGWNFVKNQMGKNHKRNQSLKKFG